MIARTSQGEDAYTVELNKWGCGDRKDLELLKLSVELAPKSQATYLESQLCRAFKKEGEAAVKAAVVKYLGSYAHVPELHVLPQLWSKAQQVLKGST